MQKLRPDDHFLILLEGDETPMHIGSLLVLGVPADQREGAAERLRDHLVERLPGSPLMRTLHCAPLGFDSDVWIAARDVDLEQHVIIDRTGAPRTDRDLDEFVEAHVMQRLDLSRPPFLIQILDPVTDDEHGGGRLAMYVRIHHSVADGVGFQHLLGMLSDDAPVGEGEHDGLLDHEQLPGRHDWLRASLADFRTQQETDAERRERRRAAVLALQDPDLQRQPTPMCALSGPTSTQRAYSRITLPFDTIHEVAQSLRATVNDLFLALAGTAMRDYLLATAELPTDPLTINSARSYRRPEHGVFGNRIVAMHPHLATDVPDPIERLRSIQASMAIERRRTEYDEALLDQLETPFGPLVRRRRFADRRSSGGSILPGNITVSNVTGPSHVRTYAGMPQLSNHPTPLLGSGRALNFTARRNAGSFDVGVMADPTKIPDVEQVAALFVGAFDTYRAIAMSSSVRSNDS